jgi:hypothetical protein
VIENLISRKDEMAISDNTDVLRGVIFNDGERIFKSQPLRGSRL